MRVCGIGGFWTTMFLIFMTLKLTGEIDWSWWWVTAPLWGPLAVVLVVFFLAALLAGACALVVAACDSKKKQTSVEG